MKKILLTAAAVAGLFAATSAVHASGEGAVCPITGKTASGETAKKEDAKSDKGTAKEGGKKSGCGGCK